VKGYRILGLGYRVLKSSDLELSRYQLELEINLVSIIILENRLKEDTAFIMCKLREAKLSLKIISGDNPLTTINCARQSGVLPAECNVTLLDIIVSQKHNIFRTILFVALKSKKKGSKK
jgi:cation-transporting ATPase 13A3/4/5